MFCYRILWFFHFSCFNIERERQLTRIYSRFEFVDRKFFVFLITSLFLLCHSKVAGFSIHRVSQRLFTLLKCKLVRLYKILEQVNHRSLCKGFPLQSLFSESGAVLAVAVHSILTSFCVRVNVKSAPTKFFSFINDPHSFKFSNKRYLQFSKILRIHRTHRILAADGYKPGKIRSQINRFFKFRLKLSQRFSH